MNIFQHMAAPTLNKQPSYITTISTTSFFQRKCMCTQVETFSKRLTKNTNYVISFKKEMTI